MLIHNLLKYFFVFWTVAPYSDVFVNQMMCQEQNNSKLVPLSTVNMVVIIYQPSKWWRVKEGKADNTC